MPTADRTLLIVERAYRGAVEDQFADVLYFVHGLHRQSGGVELALRGAAAGYAVLPDRPPALRVAGRLLGTLPDPRRSVQLLLDDGVAVWTEEPDLLALGPTAPARLIPGVRCLAADEVTARWPSYARVWFF
ncbi:MAG TPA: hypothetical protein VE547_14520 [Mycobacteriales bacterium]|nr:hypothetical protein [Mycobacteriales bacterium]